jgi:hypothetical protein
MPREAVYCILDSDLGWHRHIAKLISSEGFRVCHLADEQPPSIHEGVVVGIGRAESKKVVPESITDVKRHLRQRRRQHDIPNKFLLFDPFLVPFDSFSASLTIEEKKNEIRNAGAVLIDSVPDLPEAVRGASKPIAQSQQREIIQPELARETKRLLHNLKKDPPPENTPREAKELVEEVRKQLSEEEAENLRSKNILDTLESVLAHLDTDRNHVD